MLPAALAPLLNPQFFGGYDSFYSEMDLDQLPQLMAYYQMGFLNGAEMMRLIYSLNRRRGNRHFHWHQGGLDPRLMMLMNGGMGGGMGMGMGMGMGVGMGMGGLAGLPGIVGGQQLLLPSPLARGLF